MEDGALDKYAASNDFHRLFMRDGQQARDGELNTILCSAEEVELLRGWDAVWGVAECTHVPANIHPPAHAHTHAHSHTHTNTCMHACPHVRLLACHAPTCGALMMQSPLRLNHESRNLNLPLGGGVPA